MIAYKGSQKGRNVVRPPQAPSRLRKDAAQGTVRRSGRVPAGCHRPEFAAAGKADGHPAAKTRWRLIQCSNPGQRASNTKPPRHHTAAATKYPLLLKTNIGKTTKPDFINSIDPNRTDQTGLFNPRATAGSSGLDTLGPGKQQVRQ